MNRPLVLLILDGFGYRENPDNNAIAGAKTPCLTHLWETYPHSLLDASGQPVGLPAHQMGNSEVGHMNIGAGRVLTQELTRIEAAIATGQLAKHPVLQHTFQQVKAEGVSLHLMGLFSPGGVHSHEDHFYAVLEAAMAAGVARIYLHPILDGRDCPPKSAEASLRALQARCEQLHTPKIATLIGRYYAMDRDGRWDRIEKAYRLYTSGQCDRLATSAVEALQAAYQAGETDEFVAASLLDPTGQIQPQDYVMFMNFRADRARQITRAMTDPHFTEFVRPVVLKPEQWVTLTQYDATFQSPVLFPPANVRNTLGEVLAQQGLKQLRIAETEKYAHVTFFFNGGVEAAFPGEDRQLIASPKVATYDLQPEMSAPEVTDHIVKAIVKQKYDVIIANYANADMVGHTGNYEAAVQAIEYLDAAIAKIVQALAKVGGELLITADHGNADCMYDHAAHQPHTAHTHAPVPFIYVGTRYSSAHSGALSDIAPTMLMLLNLPQPPEMTGHSLLKT